MGDKSVVLALSPLYLYLYLFNGPGREDVIGQVGCLRPVVKKNCL